MPALDPLPISRDAATQPNRMLVKRRWPVYTVIALFVAGSLWQASTLLAAELALLRVVTGGSSFPGHSVAEVGWPLESRASLPFSATAFDFRRPGATCLQVYKVGVFFAALANEAPREDHAPHEGAESEVPLNPLEFRTDLALWTGVVFVVLLAILGPLAWSPIARALDRRERHLAEQFAEAERRLQKAEELLRQHQERLQRAGEEAQRILQKAVDEAERRAAEILAQARTEAESEHRRRLEQLEKAADEASRQLVQYAASLAVEIAGRVLRSQLDAATHRRLLREGLSQLAQIAKGNSEGGVPAASASGSPGEC